MSCLGVRRSAMTIRRVRLSHLSVMLALLAVFLTAAGLNKYPTPDPQETTSFTSRNAKIPDLTWKPVNGEEIRLRSLDGYAIFIAFMDPTNERHTAQLPLFKSIMDKYESKGLKLINVVAAAYPDSVEPLSYFEGYDWPVVVWNDTDVLEGAGVTSLPTNSIIDRQGNVIMKYSTVNDRTQWMVEGAIAAALR